MPRFGEKIPLSLQLYDNNADQFVQASVYDKEGNELDGSPVLLTHVAGGLYLDSSLAMPALPVVVAQYVVYEDEELATENQNYGRAVDLFELTSESGSGGSVTVTTGQISGEVEGTGELVGSVESAQTTTGTVEDSGILTGTVETLEID